MNVNTRTGLLGEHLGHSISAFLHGLLGDTDYQLIEKAPSEVESFVKSDAWQMLNVTIPYKKTVLSYCDESSERVQKCGCANLLIRRNGKIYADNTDYAGFLALCEGIDLNNKKVAVLGTGGVSGTIQAVVRDLGAKQIVCVSRTHGVRYEDVQQYADCDVLINATPVGMYPNLDDCPVDLDVFTNLYAVFDVIANPLRTRLVYEAQKRGIRARGGLRMLCAQAHEARRIFEQTNPALSEPALYRETLSQKESIVLIGMPGSGKSTFAHALADEFSLPYHDSDTLVEARTKMSIPALIQTQGESAFRAVEAEVIRELSALQGCVIATGGGAILNANSRRSLGQNALVVHIDCPLCELSREGRPLSSSDEALNALWKTREPLYRDCPQITFSYSKQDPNATDKLLALIQRHREEQ